MVANTPPTHFTFDPARADEFIDDLSAVENSLHDVASKWKTTTGALSLFLASPEGLAIVASAEIATAVHIRLQAQALLVDVAQSMVYIVREYSREEQRIPFKNDLTSMKLVELRRANARRAGQLLFRLAHYTPAPIRSYAVRPVAEQSDQTSGMPKRPLGHGDASEDSMCGTAVALDSRGPVHKSHACAEPQACHTNETSRVSTANDVVAVPLTISARACPDHLPPCEADRASASSATTDIPANPREILTASSEPILPPAPPAPTESPAAIIAATDGSGALHISPEPSPLPHFVLRSGP